jgi:CRP/FNR family cyclic AMP-dependent transcriptional regulator
MKDAKLEALVRVPLFSGLAKKDLIYLTSRVDDVRVGPGTTLTRQGMANNTFYLVLDGEVVITVDGEPRATLHPGDFLGEISMLELTTATATAITQSPARLLVMSHRQFHDAILGNKQLRAVVSATEHARLLENTRAVSAGTDRRAHCHDDPPAEAVTAGARRPIGGWRS